jgi:conjugative relaxase-like TrwC/TraI family protein
VVSASSIAAVRGGGYARYLEGRTVEPERGDYYLQPGGEPTAAPGRWLTDPETLARFGIAPSEPVEGAHFVALMEGRDPRWGGWLRPPGADGGRGGGIDLTFSAPKSVSVAWALADGWQREQIEQAHANAVEQWIEYLRCEIPAVRRRRGGPAVEEPAKDLVAAAYRHTTARGVSGARAPDPQLHSHVVITAAVRDDDRVVAVASRPIFRRKRELGAYYRSALAQELQQIGLAIRSRTGNKNRYFEIQGVPATAIDAFSQRTKEVAREAERFHTRYGRAPLPGELRHLKLEGRKAKQLTTRRDLDRAWSETGRRLGFGPDQALQLIVVERPHRARGTLADRIEPLLTEERALFTVSTLRAVALEQSVGELAPEQALVSVERMIRDHRIIALDGGRLTTRAQRERELAIARHVTTLARDTARRVVVRDRDREIAGRVVAERIAAPLTPEQHVALQTITGPERVAVLIGPAGTGKGVVIDAAARAEQHARRQTIGVAVSGSTAERLGHDSPALNGRTMTVDALTARGGHSVQIGADTTVYLDEAGMIDTRRLERLTSLIERSGAKLVAIGDGRQLPSIGAGGMFDHIAQHAPVSQLEQIHRTRDREQQLAWGYLRDGRPEHAIAYYHSKGQLFVRDTREQAGEAAVNRWAQLTQHHDIASVAILTDASNLELHRLNARAQHHRIARGELGDRELELRSVPYSLRHGDRVAFTAQHRPPGERRVENGSRATITAIVDRGLEVELDGTGRRVTLDRADAEKLRLNYARHIYREQGATLERAIVITGGWQTNRQATYVEASRARHRTEWFLARDELGHQGQDPDRIQRLAEHIRQTRAHSTTLNHHPVDYDLLERPGLSPELNRPRLPSLTRLVLPDRHDRRPEHDDAHDRGR